MEKDPKADSTGSKELRGKQAELGLIPGQAEVGELLSEADSDNKGRMVKDAGTKDISSRELKEMPGTSEGSTGRIGVGHRWWGNPSIVSRRWRGN